MIVSTLPPNQMQNKAKNPIKQSNENCNFVLNIPECPFFF